jgi:hypothetical protein
VNLFFARLSKKVMYLAIIVCSALLAYCTLLAAAVPIAAPQQQITFNSLTGIYHLSRDKHGLSLLTTEETIVTHFPASGFTGIKRILPESYQGHNVNVKILNVTDVAGDPVPFKTATDNNGNLVITTGDPDITLVGSQTIKINYQTTGVINLSQKVDEFLLDINGKGWDRPFSKVGATLYIPSLFRARLTSSPICYLSPDASASACRLSTQKNKDATVITTSATNVPPRQSLVVRLRFQPSTFTNPRASFVIPLLVGLIGSVVSFVIIFTATFVTFRDRKTKSA